MHIFTVRTLTQAVKDVLEGGGPFVWVRGQVSNLSRPPSRISFDIEVTG